MNFRILGHYSQCQNEQNDEKTSEDDQISEQRVNDHNSDVVAGIDYSFDRKKLEQGVNFSQFFSGLTLSD